MRTPILLILIVGLLALAGCAQRAVEPTACTADAKLCPDGSAVGRVAPSCEFAPCPLAEGAELVYRITDPAECRAALFTCGVDEEPFFDDNGCGCKPSMMDGKRYVGSSADECATIRFTCEDGEEYFADESGCGCAS